MTQAPPEQGGPPGQDATRSDLTGSVLAGGAWTSANILLPYLLTAVVSIVAARVLGPSEMGRQSFIAFVTLIGTALCAAGLPMALTRSVGEAVGRGRPSAVAGLVRTVWLVETPLALLGMTALLLVAAAGAEPSAAWTLAAVTVFAGALGTVPLAALSGTLQWKAYSVAILSTNVAATALTLGALALGWGITGIVAARLLQTAVVSLWSAGALRAVLHRNEWRPRREPELERTMLRYAAGTSVSVLLTLVVYQRSEVFFLNHFSENAQIAEYAIASSALTILLAPPQALGVALAPALSSLHGAGELDRIRAGYSKALRISLLGTLPALGLAAILGPPLLLLFYGESYRGVQTVFLILLPSLLVVPLISASAGVLTAYRRVRAPVVALTAAASVDLLAAYALVPSHGATGAAAANVAALAVAALLQLVPAVRLVHGVDLDARHLIHAAAASGVAAAVGFAVLQALPTVLDVVLGPAVFVAVFAAVAYLIGIASNEDARWLEDLLGRAHPRLARIVARIAHP